jgi:hypothetical protein
LLDDGLVSRQGLVPEAVEVGAHSADPVRAQLVDAPSSRLAVDHQPASLSTLRCCETAGRLIGSSAASAPTARGRSAWRSKIARLLGSPSAVQSSIRYRIPAGANVVVSPWATHRHPAYWEDPERFDPDRFTAERNADRHRWSYFPFGGGPRACIGSHFATLETAIALAVLAQRFRVRADPGRPELDAAGLTLRPKRPVPIQLTHRGV